MADWKSRGLLLALALTGLLAAQEYRIETDAVQPPPCVLAGADQALGRWLLTGPSGRVSALTLSHAGSGSPASLTNLRLYLDLGTPAALDVDDQLLASGAVGDFTAGSDVFDFSASPIDLADSSRVLLVADVSGDPLDTHGAAIAIAGDVSADVPASAGLTFPVSLPARIVAEELGAFDFETTPGSGLPAGSASGLTVLPLRTLVGNASHPAGNDPSSGESYSASGWQAGNAFILELVPAAGKTLTLCGIDFDERASGTGPASFELAVGGQAAFSAATSGSFSAHPMHSVSLASAAAWPVSDTVRLVLTGSGASSSGGTWRLDNVVLYGVVGDGSPTPALDAQGTTDFGGQAVGQTAIATWTLANTGTADLTVTGLHLSGSHAGDYALLAAPSLPATLAPGASESFDLSFTPATSGARSAQLEVVSNSGGVSGTPSTFALAGSGSAAALLVGGNATLGSVPLAQSSGPQSWTLENTGNLPLDVSAIEVIGNDASDFSLGLPGLPLTLAPGASNSFTIDFAPSAVGPRAATLRISSTAGAPQDFVLDASGAPGAPDYALFAVQDFGAARVGSTGASSPHLFRIDSNGLSDLVVTAIASSAPGEFSIVSGPSLPLTLAPGTSASFEVSFHPTSAGTITASVDITSDAGGTPGQVEAVAVTGIGTVLSGSNFGGAQHVSNTPQAASRGGSSAECSVGAPGSPAWGAGILLLLAVLGLRRRTA